MLVLVRTISDASAGNQFCVKAPIQVVIVVSRSKAASGYAASFLPRILIIESFISQLEPALLSN